MTISKIGSEIHVNTITASSQFATDVEFLGNGSFVVVWDDFSGDLGEDSSFDEVKGRIFSSSGHAIADEFRVNVNQVDFQQNANIAPLPGGGFAVVFEDGSDATVGGTYITMRSFAGDGDALTGDLRVSGGPGKYYASYPDAVALDNDTVFIIHGAEDSVLGLTAKLPSGASSEVFSLPDRFGDDHDVLADVFVPQHVALLPDDKFVHVFEGLEVNGDGEIVLRGLLAQVHAPNGDALDLAFQINADPDALIGLANVATLADGRFVVTWQESTDSNDPASVLAHIYGADGASLSETFMVNADPAARAGQPDIAALSSGGFVITWSEFPSGSGPAPASTIKVREYGVTGEAVGDDQVVSTQAGRNVNPHVSAAPDDGLVVTWTNASLNGADVEAQLLKAHVNPAAFGDQGDDVLVGRAGGATLHGLGGDDRLLGGTGADLLDGGAGADHMEGKKGNDTYVVDNIGDTITEVFAGNVDTVQTTLSHYTLAKNLENLTYTGAGAFDGVGNTSANALRGGVGDDRLDGLSGADILAGGKGDDVYVVDRAGDVVRELRSQGVDTIQSRVSFVASANVENLTLLSTPSIDATGNELDNRLTGNAGYNVLDGMAGADFLIGGGGYDTFVFRFGLDGYNDQLDTVMDFQGAGGRKGDVLKFVGFGSDATIEHLDGEMYKITAGPGHDGGSQYLRLVGVANLDLHTGAGHDDIVFV